MNFKINTIVRPYAVFGVIFIGELFFTCAVLVNAIPTFVLDSANLDGGGILFVLLVQLIALMLLYGLCHAESSRKYRTDIDPVNLSFIDSNRIRGIVLVLTLFTVCGMLYLIGNTAAEMELREYLIACLQNKIKYSAFLESGHYYILVVIPMVNCVLLSSWVICKRRGIVLLVGNLICALVLAVVLGTRLLFVETIALSILILFRRFWFYERLKLSYALLGLMITCLLLLAITVVAAYRDYDFEGYLYTSDVMAWGVSRVFDYPLSTLIYSSHVFEAIGDSFNMGHLFPLLERLPFADLANTAGAPAVSLQSSYGQSYYTNVGGLTELYASFGFWAPLVLIGYLFITAGLYIGYMRGTPLCVALYPFALFSIFEYWRTFHLCYEVVQVAIILICIVYFVSKPPRNTWQSWKRMYDSSPRAKSLVFAKCGIVDG